MPRRRHGPTLLVDTCTQRSFVRVRGLLADLMVLLAADPASSAPPHWWKEHCYKCFAKQTTVISNLLPVCSNCGFVQTQEAPEELPTPRPTAHALRLWSATPAHDPDYLLPKRRRKPRVPDFSNLPDLSAPRRALHSSPAGLTGGLGWSGVKDPFPPWMDAQRCAAPSAAPPQADDPPRASSAIPSPRCTAASRPKTDYGPVRWVSSTRKDSQLCVEDGEFGPPKVTLLYHSRGPSTDDLAGSSNGGSRPPSRPVSRGDSTVGRPVSSQPVSRPVSREEGSGSGRGRGRAIQSARRSGESRAFGGRPTPRPTAPFPSAGMGMGMGGMGMGSMQSMRDASYAELAQQSVLLHERLQRAGLNPSMRIIQRALLPPGDVATDVCERNLPTAWSPRSEVGRRLEMGHAPHRDVGTREPPAQKVGRASQQRPAKHPLAQGVRLGTEGRRSMPLPWEPHER